MRSCINGTKVECKDQSPISSLDEPIRINGTKVECKVPSSLNSIATPEVLMEPKWNVKQLAKGTDNWQGGY